MSRKYYQDGKNHMAFGLDNTVGYFFQVWETDQDGEDKYLVDMDMGSFQSNSRGEIIKAMKKWGVPFQWISCISLDIDFNQFLNTGEAK